MSLTRSQIMTSARFAGGVRRYHTWPVLTHQTNADHTYHVIRLYVQIFGEITSDVTRYLVFHDSGELKTGDMPFPIKAQNPVLKAEADRLEDEGKLAMGVPHIDLDAPMKLRVKALDLLEMCEFGLCELDMGNTFAVPIVRDTYKGLRNVMSAMTIEEQELVEQYLAAHHIARRGELHCS